DWRKVLGSDRELGGQRMQRAQSGPESKRPPLGGLQLVHLEGGLLNQGQVDRRFTTVTAGFDFIGDLVVLVETVDAGTLHSGNVDEVVLAAGFRGDEAKSLGGIEELHGAF